MRIENDVKLDFKDVLIRPKRSTLTTRSQVDISREFRFRHAGVEYAGIPIVASNMDTTGTIDMARALDPFRLSVALHKHYEVDEIVDVLPRARAQERGVLLDGHPGRGRGEAARGDGKLAGTGADSAIRYLCIDVANGYTESLRPLRRRRCARPIRTSSSWPATSSPAR